MHAQTQKSGNIQTEVLQRQRSPSLPEPAVGQPLAFVFIALPVSYYLSVPYAHYLLVK